MHRTHMAGTGDDRFRLVGVPGIEPGLYAPEAHVLPVYYTPKTDGMYESSMFQRVCTFDRA